jgi:hypothetical protein
MALGTEDLIRNADISIFTVESQTLPGDRQTFIDCQNIIRNRFERYVYLEVGSHLGGTLLPHLLDPHCASAISIDPRPASQTDERGRQFDYPDNSSGRMIELLSRHVPRGAMLKLQTYDVDTSALAELPIAANVRLALIDGEHTNRAVFRDFLRLLPYLEKDSIVLFHDANLVFDALLNIEEFLLFSGTKHKALFLPDIVFAIALGLFAPVAAYAFSQSSIDRAQFITKARMDLDRTISANLAKGLAR